MIKATDITNRALELLGTKPQLSPQALAVIQSVTEAFNAELAKLKPAKPPGVSLGIGTDDADWLKSLSANPTYAGLDIVREFGKMQAWCSANKAVSSRRRFINWINKAERPLNAGPAAGRAGMPEWAPTQAMLKAYAHEKWPDMDLTVFIISYHHHRSGRGWKIKNQAVDWKIDFSEQVNKKRQAV